MTKTEKRKPRAPTSSASAVKDEEASILAVMSGWLQRMEDAMKPFGGMANFGSRFFQASLELELRDPDPGGVKWVVGLAINGHAEAQRAIDAHLTRLLEGGDLSSLTPELLALMGRAIARIPMPSVRKENTLLKNMSRDSAIRIMVDVASERFGLPKFDRTKKSAAWFVARVLTQRGTKISAEHVWKIYKSKANFSANLTKHLNRRIPW